MPSFVEIGPLVLEKKIFEQFLTYMGMAAIWIIYLHIGSPSYRCLYSSITKFCFDWTSISEKMFEYYDNAHVFCHGVGTDEPLGSIVFQNYWYLGLQVTLHARIQRGGPGVRTPPPLEFENFT